MIKKITIIITIVSISWACSLPIIATDGDINSMASKEINETNQEEKKSIFFQQDEIIEVNFQLLKTQLSLSKKQVRKISSKYDKYLKNQLKIKEKIVGSKVRLSRLMRERFYDDYQFDDIINDIFSKKKKMYKNSVFFVKELEDKLKKEQIIRLRPLVPELYNPIL
ncbi:hypothetical protein DID74_01465 [Candidatus Marinamargulisbacteria bacterium SCGC AG-333-B06]|nr:hypothetical protein DID74_01465 [Candidatus Marinamargulisbacteria bacterium SCGC AG-333-B06]